MKSAPLGDRLLMAATPPGEPAAAMRRAPHAGCRSLLSARAAAWVAVMLVMAWRIRGLDSRGLWFDESFSWQLTRRPWPEMLARARLDVHPPLYYAHLKLWTGLFGDSVFAMRTLSVAWFLVALAGAFLFCREAGATRGVGPGRTAPGADSGPIAALFLVASPFLFRYCQEARMYSQMAALAALGSWLLLRASRERERPAAWWGAYGIVAAALAYTHNFGLFTLAAQLAFVLCLLAAGRRALGGTPPAPSLRWAAATALIVAVLYLPWVPTLLAQGEQVSEDYWTQSLDRRSAFDVGALRAAALGCLVHDRADQAVPHSEEASGTMLGDGLIASVAAILILLGLRGGRAGLYLALGVAVPVGSAIAISAMVGRNIVFYRYFACPYVLLLVGLALLIGRLPSAAVRWLLAGQVAFTLAFLTYRYQESSDPHLRTDSRGACDHIAANWRAGDLVLCLRPRDFFPMEYHARGRFAVHQARYPGHAIRHYTGGPLFREEDYLEWGDALARPTGRIWVVDNESQQFEPPAGHWGDGWARVLAKPLRFPEPIRFRGALLLDLWAKRAAPGCPTADSQAPPRDDGRPAKGRASGAGGGPGWADGVGDRPGGIVGFVDEEAVRPAGESG
jgi:mannosyltransferase